MKYTIGDVLTVVGFVFGILVSVWALLVVVGLLFPKKAEYASRQIETRPWGNFITGVVAYAVAAFATIVLLNIHNPLFTLLGWGVAVFFIAIMVVGGGGFAMLAANRIKALDPRRSTYRGLERGALLLVVSCGLLPVIGWFAFTPVVMLISLGAGTRAVFFSGKQPAYIPSQSPITGSDSSR